MTLVDEFFAAAKAGDVSRLSSLLAVDRSLIGARDAAGQSAILLAQYYRRLEAVDFLHRQGRDLDLFEAAAVGDLAAAQKAVGGDAGRVRALSPDGFTPLHLAAFFGHESVVRFLLAEGALVSAASANAMRVAPLHSALAGRHPSIARLLLEHGADPNARQQEGWTPLHQAAANGDRPTSELLIHYGAEAGAPNDKGRRPRDLALESGHETLAAFIAAQGRSSG